MKIKAWRKNMIHWTLILLVILLLPAVSFAVTHYVTPSGSGTKDGRDWSNAFTGIPATLTRGDTYVLSGGTYGAYTFDDALSGTTYIYIRKASATLDAGISGWSSSYATNQAVFTSSSTNQWIFATGYYDIDGGTPTAKWQTSGYGIKLTPGNVNQNSGLVTFGAAGNNIVLKKIEFANQGSAYDYAQYGIGEGAGANVTIQYCYFHDNQNHIRFSAGDNWLVEYCYFGPNISTSAHHGEGFAYVSTSGHTFRFNYVNGADVGTGCHISLGGSSYTNANLVFYGNVYVNISHGGNATFGSGNSSDMETLPNWKIYNNTFLNSYAVKIGCGISGYPNRCSGWDIKNNLFYNSTVGYMNATNKPAASTYSKNYYNTTTYGWTASTDDISSSEALNILFPKSSEGDYRPGSSSPAVDKGNDLGPTYNRDAFGTYRPQRAGWDIGAFEAAEGLQSPGNFRKE